MWHGSFVPEIFIGVSPWFFTPSSLGPAVLKTRKILLGSNYYCGEVIMPAFPWTCCCCPRFSSLFLCFCYYIFYLICRFCLLVSSFLNFPFSDVFQSEMWCEFFTSFPVHLQPLVSCVQETVFASKAEGTICTYLASFKHWKLWASSNCFRYMPAMLRPTCSAWFFEVLLL